MAQAEAPSDITAPCTPSAVTCSHWALPLTSAGLSGKIVSGCVKWPQLLLHIIPELKNVVKILDCCYTPYAASWCPSSGPLGHKTHSHCHRFSRQEHCQVVTPFASPMPWEAKSRSEEADSLLSRHSLSSPMVLSEYQSQDFTKLAWVGCHCLLHKIRLHNNEKINNMRSMHKQSKVDPENRNTDIDFA